MKTHLTIAAGLLMSSAAIAQTDMRMTSSEAGYPPCSARITDECIQLHERGVGSSSNVAMTSRSEAMGGPYEPVTAHAESLMHEGKTSASYEGAGGPIEDRTGYPPCSRPGPGEDSCIQLHERGVIGAGD